MVSPYDVLRVDQDADEKEIEEAYRERIKQTHPDQGGSKEEFQLVKSAYQEIQSASTRNTAGGRRQSETEELRCSKCDSLIPDVSQATYRQQTEEIFCPDCVVDTYCRSCGKDLRLSIDQFSAVDGEPICMSCDQRRQSTNQDQSTTTINKIPDSLYEYAIYILTGGVIGSLVGFYAVSFYLTGGTEQATFAIRQFLENLDGTVISVFVWLYLILLIQAYRKK
jgi:hypothetical protein